MRPMRSLMATEEEVTQRNGRSQRRMSAPRWTSRSAQRALSPTTPAPLDSATALRGCRTSDELEQCYSELITRSSTRTRTSSTTSASSGAASSQGIGASHLRPLSSARCSFSYRLDLARRYRIVAGVDSLASSARRTQRQGQGTLGPFRGALVLWSRWSRGVLGEQRVPRSLAQLQEAGRRRSLERSLRRVSSASVTTVIWR